MWGHMLTSRNPKSNAMPIELIANTHVVEPLIRIQDAGSYGDLIAFRMAMRNRDTGEMMIAQPVELKLRDERMGSIDEPAMILLQKRDSEAFLRSMMDQLWAMGVRPSDIGTPGHLAATQEHLKTCKDIIDKLLPVVCQK
jgi:hypothetical protein